MKKNTAFFDFRFLRSLMQISKKVTNKVHHDKCEKITRVKFNEKPIAPIRYIQNNSDKTCFVANLDLRIDSTLSHFTLII